MKTFTAWIALSQSGYPVPFLGFALTKEALKLHYVDKFPSRGLHGFDQAGYTAVKVRIAEIER